ncbi:MAG: extracellular solute-binding protein [Wohlfahrtiimonas sp.]
MRKNIKLSKALLALSLGLCFPLTSVAALSVSYDQMSYQELPTTVLYPFSYQGLVSIRENNLPNGQSYLPKNLPDYWDVVVVGRDILEQECKPNGLLEVLDYENFPHKDLLTIGAIQQCGVGFSVQGMTLNYALIHKYGVPPTHWVDFFDFNRFPGKRALPKQSKYLLEAVLLADGVQPSYLYPLLATKEGQDRAFKKLDLIYDEILWWSDVENLKLWLEQGIVSMSIAPDGAMLSKDGVDTIGVSRQQVMYEMKYYAMLKDSQQKDLAYAFISYATQPDQQLKLANQQYYGPTIKQAWRLVSPNTAEYITNNPKNLQGGILLDYNFYAEHGAELEKRFNEWLVSKEAPVKRVSMAGSQKPVKSVVKQLGIGAEDIDISLDSMDVNFIGPRLELLEENFFGPQLIDYIEETKSLSK